MMSRAIDGNSITFYRPAHYEAEKASTIAQTTGSSQIIPKLTTVTNSQNDIAFNEAIADAAPSWCARDRGRPPQDPLVTLDEIKVSLNEAKTKFIQETARENSFSLISPTDYNAVICEARSKLNNINATLDLLCDVIEHTPYIASTKDNALPLPPTIKLTRHLKSISPAA